MNENFEKDIAKCIESTVNDLEAKIFCCLRKNSEDADIIKVGKPLKYLYYDQHNGIVKLQVTFAYTSKEIEFLKSIKGLSKDKLKNLEEYMEKLSKED
ncbi:MAG: hypothetical protein K2K85_07780 [Clostridia bacterium]|nr:hypothetical protein [Clostridia bacterium]